MVYLWVNFPFYLFLSLRLVYIGVLFYGTNSLEILFGLQDYEHYLQSEILRLKSENAGLQKDYFELKEISAPVSIKSN